MFKNHVVGLEPRELFVVVLRIVMNLLIEEVSQDLPVSSRRYGCYY